MTYFDDIAMEETKKYLTALPPNHGKRPRDIKDDLRKLVYDRLQVENALLPKNQHTKMPSNLLNSQIAEIILHTQPVVNVACAGMDADPELDLLCIYQSTGPDMGLYSANKNVIGNLIEEFNYNAGSKNISEVISILRRRAPRMERTIDRDLIPVNNGVFHYVSKQLLPFSKDYIFLAKTRVDYVDNPVNPVIHNPIDSTDWDFESWMEETFPDAEVRQLMWEIIGAILRPFVPWNKAALFYSPMGNNGKGTLCQMFRNLAGPGTSVSISLADLGKDFMLEQLIRANCIITDENDCGLFVDKAANLKEIITNDMLMINRKHKTAISFRFYGFMVQCLNEMPRIKDKSDSLFRRLLFIPFTECFTGRERKYIKSNYLNRPEVLQYVLNKALNMSYYELSTPTVCVEALNAYKSYNDTVRTFAEEIVPQLQWDLVPYSFLYALYKAWYAKNSSGTVQGRNTFIEDFRNLIRSGAFPEWYVRDDDAQIRTKNLMDKPEVLICEYDIKEWMNPAYVGNDFKKKALPLLKKKYKGILRHNPKCGETPEVADDSDDYDDNDDVA